MPRLIILLITVLLSNTMAQVKVIPTGKRALQQAQILERQGKIDEAQAIYYGILETNPRNHQAYRSLKNSLLRTGDFDATVTVITNYLKHNPQDLGGQIELGELYYLMDRKSEADQHWKQIELKFKKNRNYYHTMLFTLVRLSLTEKIDSLVVRGRKEFNDPALMATDLANYYAGRGAISRAVNEYINHLLARPKQQQFVTNRILMLSDESENFQQIESTLLSRLPENESLLLKLLAAYYFKIRQYEKAIDQHLQLGLVTPMDFDRWLKLAANLRAENEFGFSLTVYQTILTKDRKLIPMEVIGAALLGMGQCYENQIIPTQKYATLVGFFPDNIIFENHFYGAPEISTKPLEHSFALYDSVLTELPLSTYLPQVHFRLGEIKYRITRDFDGAARSYQAAITANPKPDLKSRIRLRIGDIYLAKGDASLAREYFNQQLSRENNSGNISPFLLRLVQANLLMGDIESALTLIETTLSESGPDQAYFNDLMEIQDLIVSYYSAGSNLDQAAFLVFLNGENFVRQNKLNEAILVLTALREESPNAKIIPLATLREALLRLAMDDQETALALANLLTETQLAEIGITLLGEIYELNGNPEKSLLNYHRLLEEYPLSILTEPVRFRVRELNIKSGS
ncbi:MAG: tetratricopeptide repeat protein [Candidatus Marinimicrobia bacterium]|nr:tetratricopeptide repeat protein [Candidatus Neomarinimicrobiota bacterium]